MQVEEVSGGPLTCSPAALTLGSCLPGAYLLRYTYARQFGSTGGTVLAQAELAVLVERRYTASLNYTFATANRCAAGLQPST